VTDTTSTWLADAGRSSDWSGVSATVAGLGRSGFAAADALLRVGARVEVIETAVGGATELDERAQILETLGATVRLGVGTDHVIDSSLLIPSPGLPPHHPWLRSARATVIWSGEQLAWQLRPEQVPWLTVTGTNGKTTTVQLVDSMLRAAGHLSATAGNIGRPLVEAIFAEPLPEVLVVELSSFQLHFTPAIHAHSSALLNIARDHVDWHGTFDAYTAAKARVFEGTRRSIVYNHDDSRTEQLAEDADVEEGCRAVGFTLGVPGRAMLGVVDGTVVDRAFVAERATHAVEVVDVASLPVEGPHNVANVLAAAALARSFGVSVSDVRSGALAFAVDAHRGDVVGVVDDVRFIDNSKATNVHAADRALAAAAEREGSGIVWIAGGLAKGGQFDDLVLRHGARLRAAVLLGADRGLIADAIARHAPQVPVIDVPDGETEPMDHAVRAAAALARPRDTVLLAPACASMDQFTDYQARGRAFVDAVTRLRR
jgi:UDP-N-acetylmuramoylalanine--D-glutamate ligase